MPTMLVSTGRSSRADRRGGNVAAVIGGADEDRVGDAPVRDLERDGGCELGTGKRLTYVPDVIHRRGAVGGEELPPEP